MYNDRIVYKYTVERIDGKIKTTIYMLMEKYGQKANEAYYNFLDKAYDNKEDDNAYISPSILASEEIEGDEMSMEMKMLLKSLRAEKCYGFDYIIID